MHECRVLIDEFSWSEKLSQVHYLPARQTQNDSHGDYSLPEDPVASWSVSILHLAFSPFEVSKVIDYGICKIL